jgi:hypothetical protein
MEKINNEVVKKFYTEFVGPAVEWYKRLQALKPHIVKGRKPDPNKPAKQIYRPPMSAQKDLKLVADVYDHLLKEAKQELIEAIINRDIDQAEPYLKALQAGEIKKDIDYTFISRYLTSSDHRHYPKFDTHSVKPKEERLKIARPLAEKEADAIAKEFTVKNLKKVTSLVGERGELSTVKAKHVSFGRGKLEGKVHFVFKDGGEFVVNNQVVSVWTYGRSPFYRFPTTFHDIVFSSGKKVKSESEEFMNKTWAVENKQKSEKLAESVLRLYGVLESNTLPKQYADNKEAMDMIRAEIENMAYEIKQSEKGQRSGFRDMSKMVGDDEVNTSSKSTFPTYLQHIFNGSGTAQKFLSAAKLGKGIVWARIALEAIDRLEGGYKNSHGYDGPSREFIELTQSAMSA